ncbi:MAG: RNA 2',3'-cyclic phosphodiesterase [Bacillus sp. (in: firmicutes)]
MNHYFIAIPLPEEVKCFLGGEAQKISKKYPFHKWVHQEDFHITLAFLGASEVQKWQNCIEKVAEAIRDEQPFSLELTHFGTFGQPQKPRIFWCGLKYEERLFRLQRLVFAACKQSGYSLADQPFNPHITMARKYKGETAFSEHDLAACDADLGRGISFQAQKVSLFESHIDKVPKYQEIKTIYI